MNEETLCSAVDAEADRLRELARQIWETPEVALSEDESSRHLSAELEREGFDVERGIGGLPTAFVARYGTGSPTIGVLGEYDALPGLSQAAKPEREPIREGSPGHGCGHNLHGVGALGGAIAAKRAIDGGLEGTIVYCGCPAEETLVGKPYMARAGAFDDLDAALAWHPSDLSRVRLETANALDSVEYVFEGKAAHAAAAPETGRSALDAVQLLNTGVEYLREHIPDDALLHYVITDGGDAPNVVPARAAVKYFVRAPTRSSVERLSARLDDVAEGAARMTQTEVTRRFITGCHSYRPNRTLGSEVWNTMQRVGSIDYTDADREFASELQDTVDRDTFESQLSSYPDDVIERIRGRHLYSEPVEPFDQGDHSNGTADLGEVCRITPTVQFRGATWPVGTPIHTWQAVAANGDFATKGVSFAAKVFAGTVYRLLTDPKILDEAWSEHEDRAGDREYTCSVPPDVDPPTP